MAAGNPLAVVIGSAGGIGKSTASLLIQAGYRVIGADLRKTEIPSVESFELDITDRTAASQFAQILLQREEKVDALVVSAAVHSTHPAEFLPDQLIDQVMDVNLLSHIKLLRDFLPLMSDGGSVVGVSSIAACVGVPMSSLYSASKSGLEGFYESLRTEQAYRGIRVSVVHPGNVNTGFNETGNSYTTGEHPKVDENYSNVVSRIDSRYGIAPEKVAGVVLAVLKKSRPRFCYVVGMNARKASWAKKLLGRDLALKLMAKFFGF